MEKSAIEKSGVDPITLEVLRQSIPAVCDEMSVVLRLTAYNMFIYEIKDYSTALMSPEGELLGQNRGGIPFFLADLGPIIQAGVADIGRENFAPGDVILMNEASVCGQHLNNVVVYSPVFFDNRLVAFSVARGHWIDIGGGKMSMGFSRTFDIYQEGLQFRSLKFYEAGKPNKALFDMLKYNLRRPDLTLGDLRAQIAACRLGERRLIGILEKYGRDTVFEAVRVIADQGEQRSRKGIEAIPDGVYEAESFLDNDGVNLDQTIPIKVRVTVQGSEMTIDFTGTGKQVQGPLNSGVGALITARSAIKLLTSPNEDANEGHFRPLNIIAPEGTFITAKPPAPMSVWSVGLSTVLDTILTALAPAMPHQIPAGHKSDQGDFGFFGVDEKTGKYWLCGNIRGGGHGGRPHEDGENAAVNLMQGDITTAPVEEIESKYPLLVEQYCLIDDSGGAGKHRGGLGTEWHIRPFRVSHVFVNVGGERFKCPPWGLWGGKPGAPNYYVLEMGDGSPPEVVTKRPAVRLPQNASVRMCAGGGGGWGNPFEREPEKVLADVLSGYVSREKAMSDYGVVIDPKKNDIDWPSTRAMRAKADGQEPSAGSSRGR